MPRQSIYELRIISALALSAPDYERSRDELIQVLGRGSYVDEAAASLQMQGALIEDRAAGIYRLLPGRARELLGLPRQSQRELISDDVLLQNLGKLAEGAAIEVMARETEKSEIPNPKSQIRLWATRGTERAAHSGVTVARYELPTSHDPGGGKGGVCTRASSHDHEHDRNEDSKSMSMSMVPCLHALDENFLEKRFEVGALGKKSAREILLSVTEIAPDLSPDFKEGWVRRIMENPRLVWRLANEVKQRHDVRSKAGWINAAYLREMGLK